jgi:pimeloyl-ACP methyl ester carboxylesterase
VTEVAVSGRARVAYDVTGEGPDVLLLHAGVNDRRSWRHVVAGLSDGFRCIAPDMRGYGETEYEPEDGWSPHSDALAVLDAAGSGRAIVVACSMGGQCAIDLTLAHPERVAALLLIGTAVRGAPYPELTTGPTAEVEARFEPAYEAGDLDEVNRLDAWMWLDGPTAPGRVQGEARELFLAMNDRALRAPEKGPEADTPAAWPRLHEIAVPTRVLAGRLDAEDILHIAPQVAERIPQAELEHLDGVAHVPHLEADARTLAVIRTFADLHAQR